MMVLNRLFTRFVRPTGRSPEHMKRRLRLIVLLFLLGLAIPLFLLFHRVYTQLRQEALYQYRLSAERVASLLDEELTRLLIPEENRPVADYGFFRVEEQKLLKTKGLALSPLSQLPVPTMLPGLMGYFQINPDGAFSSPVLPDITQEQFEAYDIRFGEAEYAKRLDLKRQLEAVLKTNQLLSPTSSPTLKSALEEPSPAADAAAVSPSPDPQLQDAVVTHEEETARPANSAKSERLNAGLDLRSTFQGKKLDELNLDTRLYPPEPTASAPSESRSDASVGRTAQRLIRKQRKEQVDLPKSQSIEVYRGFIEQQKPAFKRLSTEPELPSQPELLSFEGEIDPIQLYILQDVTFVFVRKVWKAKQRFVQGFLIDGRTFIRSLLPSRFYNSQVGSKGRLALSYRGELLEQLEAAPASSINGGVARGRLDDRGDTVRPDQLIYQTRLVSPFNDMTVHLIVPSLPLGSGAPLVHVLAILIPVVLVGGAWGLYRLAAQQIQLAHARQNFVSAVSHELKTPLTSIRMYGEMLRSGWVPDDAKRQTYYDFIFFESERLSRLVENVLQLARLTKPETPLILTAYDPSVLLEQARSKVQSQVEAAGFALKVVDPLPDAAEPAMQIEAEEDAFTRIMINLVDNAIKFSAQAEVKTIKLACHVDSGTQPKVRFAVRDYGPGIDRQQRKKIFQLFYRVGSELTRTTPGTGIGLSLVRELAHQMHAEVDFRNHQPGAEFQVVFRALPPAPYVV